jgi:palmitoyl-protein thioesterase
MLCRFIKRVIETSVYTDWAQKSIIQAQYFRDVTKDSYFTNNIFLTDINTELDDYNQNYRNQIKKLNKMVLILFENDTMVEPKESAVS